MKDLYKKEKERIFKTRRMPRPKNRGRIVW